VPALIVADRSLEWPFRIPNTEVVRARDYLTKPEFAKRRNVKLFNLCRSYDYQSIGYYVSLLAEARGHKPMPNVITMQDMATPAMVRFVAGELDELVKRSLAPLQSDEFTLSVYFGRNLAQRYERLARELFNLFAAPLLRFRFVRGEEGWELRTMRAIAADDVPDAHHEFVVDAATKHFGSRGSRSKQAPRYYDLAILHDPDEEHAPSDAKALKKFVRAGEALGLDVELVTREDLGRLLEFDALFIRETTRVDHYTYRCSRRAAREGLVVIDDPVSIARCTNKVYLSELFRRHDVPAPRTVVVHRDNVDEVYALGWPVVLKKPDGAFSLGVVKVANDEELRERLDEYLAESDLVVAQEFLATTFDWRIGILDRRPLYASRYFMAAGHWQIVRREDNGRRHYGKYETVPIEAAPPQAVEVALRAANLVGDGLYGVDVKQTENGFYVIEVNDNPNLDAGVEDAILKDELYTRVMEVFLKRIEARKTRTPA
jgi:glutathione synthase/RimK-type ligase-like ATP-grasp enzyme